MASGPGVGIRQPSPVTPHPVAKAALVPDVIPSAQPNVRLRMDWFKVTPFMTTLGRASCLVCTI